MPARRNRRRETPRRHPWRAADPQASDQGPTHGLDDPAAVREPERLPGDRAIHVAPLPSLGTTPVVSATQSWTEQHDGSPPSRMAAPVPPASKRRTGQATFGTWSGAIEQAGFRRQKGKQARSTEQAILDALRRWAENHGVPRASYWITQPSRGRQGRSSRKVSGLKPIAGPPRDGLETRAGGPSEPRPRLEMLRIMGCSTPRNQI